MRTIIAVLLSVSVLPIGLSGQNRSGSAERETQESTIREAVIRYQMEEWRRNADAYEARAKEQWEKTSAREMNYKIYFIRLGGRDPSDEVLKGFSDFPRLVKKASQALGRASGSQGVLDRETGQVGIVFEANAIRWLDDNTVEVDGGYYCGADAADPPHLRRI